MYPQVVEVKLRFSNEIMKWEDRSVHTIFNVIPGNYGMWVTAESLDSDIQRIRLTEKVNEITKSAGAVESRWNFLGCDQGHYN